VEYYLEKMHPVYSIPLGSTFVCKPGLMKEPRDIVKVEGLIFGHTGPTGSSGSAFVWAKELLGFKSKEVWGYGGGGDVQMAYLSGELNMAGNTTGGFNASFRQYVDKGDAVIVFQGGVMDENGDIVREEAAGDALTVPELYEQIYGKKPSGIAWDAYRMIVGAGTFGKSALLPTKTKPEIVKVYRDAFSAMVKDPKFLNESTKLQGVTPHLVGEGLARVYPSGVSGSPEVVEFMRKVLSAKHGVKFD